MALPLKPSLSDCGERRVFSCPGDTARPTTGPDDVTAGVSRRTHAAWEPSASQHSMLLYAIEPLGSYT